MDGQDAGGTEELPAWPRLSTDVSHALEAARTAAVDHQRQGQDYVIHQLTTQLAEVTNRLAEVEAELASAPRPARLPDVEDVSHELIETKHDHERRTRELGAAIERMSQEIADSDERVASVETALLRARDENNELIGYLESAFTRLSGLEKRVGDNTSQDELSTLATNITERLEGEVAELRRTLDDRLADVARDSDVAALAERAESADRRLGIVDSRLGVVDERFGDVASTSDLARIDATLAEFAEEHSFTRELAANATSLAMALTDRVAENRIAASERLAEAVASLREELDAAVAGTRAAHVSDTELIEARLASLPTTDDVISLSEEIDIRLAELASKSSLSEFAQSVDERIGDLAAAGAVAELGETIAELTDEHEFTRELATNATSLSVALNDRVDEQRQHLERDAEKKLSVLRSELEGAVDLAAARHADEVKKLEIRLASLPSTEDMVALSGRLDESELLSAVRAAKQLSELREELEAALAEARAEYADEVRALEARLEGLPTIDDMSRVEDLVDARLSALPTANDVSSLAKRIDERIDGVRDRAEEAHVVAEKARDKAESADEGAAELQTELEAELSELRERLADVVRAAEAGEAPGSPSASHALPDEALERTREDQRSTAAQEARRQADRIAELEEVLARHAERLEDLDPRSNVGPRRWQRWLTEPVRIPDSPLAALPSGEESTERADDDSN